MEELILTVIYIFIIAIPISFCIWLVYILYSIPKKNGQKKLGILLSSILGLFFIYLVVSIIFEDELFSKNEAKNLLKEQNIELTDNFEITENKSMSGIGDYYHTFTLKISKKDKNKIEDEIKKSINFNPILNTPRDITKMTDRYIGRVITQNYETDNYFIRELFRPEGKKYAPTHRLIKIMKSKNELIFEDIDE